MFVSLNFVLGTASLVLEGWVVKILWNWFIPTVFTSVPAITVTQAIGICCVTGMLFTRSTDDPEQDDKKILKRVLIHCYVKPLLFLAIAAIVRLF